MKAYILILIILLSSCSLGEIETPEHVLSPKKLEAILTDLHLAEASFQINKNTENATQNLAMAYSNIYLKHDISENKFKSSLKYYSENTEQLEAIYAEVLSELQAEISRIGQ